MKKLFAIAAVGGLAAASMAVAPAAQAKTIQACVKKSDGTVKFINKKNKKCKKGWKLKTWNSAGPQGPAGPGGPAGPNWTVKDKNGVTLGTFSGYYNNGLVPQVTVTTDDGAVFRYGMDGVLDNDNTARSSSSTTVVRMQRSSARTTPTLQTVPEGRRWQRARRLPGHGCSDGQCLEDRGHNDQHSAGSRQLAVPEELRRPGPVRPPPTLAASSCR